MDRVEAGSLGIAFAGHAILLAALTLGLAQTRLSKPNQNPIEVSFVDEVALESMAPAPSQDAPAAKFAELEGPVEPEVAPQVPPTPPKAVPEPTPVKQPEPKRVAEKPAPKAEAPPKEKATRPTGRLKGLLGGISDSDSKSQSTSPPAQKAGPAVQSSLAAAIRRQLKPHWKAPTGADAEELRTELRIMLARNGAVIDIEHVRTTGQTDSNRSQVPLHREQAVRAVRLASPFALPAEYYDAWKEITVNFDKRLSQ